MRSLVTRVNKLEDLKKARHARVIFYQLEKRSQEQIVAYLGTNKCYYKQEGESHEAFKQRIELDVQGIAILRASYE